ncbi:hypothetical protein PC9H_008151 [Pleurotus ostreatus]|uniref:Glucosidase II subunit alpha n=1 Tax=Pleurotus ostreatus TaxID=5322 RepID=A0A8H7DTF2_PLEOS|nr:uncharacterized protein PC9H_008151 [Pleurotus ostreatus]KAF7428915.1 hypothetical protein PC9H_008151 [Pleurotus ostreatus]
MSATTKLDSSGLPLIPQPTDSPYDPLNYPNWLKYLILGQISTLAFLATLNVAIINPAVVPLSEEFGIAPVTATYQTTVAIGTSSLGPLIFTPFANVYGRRPAYLFAVLVGFASAVASATSTSYGGMIAARAINGFGPSAAMGLGAGTVVDVFYMHERGRAMGVFTLTMTNGAHLAPIVGGYVARNLGWRWCFWVGAILNAAMFVICLFALPETLFDRPLTTGLDENLAGSKGEVIHVESDTNVRQEPYASPPMSWRTYANRLCLWDLERPTGRRMEASDFVVKPLSMLRYPSVAFPALFYAVTYGFASIEPALTLAPIFTRLYHFDTVKNGSLGELCSGPVTDYMMRRARQRHQGDGEPPAEIRLQGIWTGAIAVPVGLLICGCRIPLAGGDRSLAYFFCVIDGFTVQFSNTFVAPCIGMALACFGERPVAWSGSMYSLKLLGALVLLISVPQTFAVKSHDFKTCSQAGFCRRGRALASRAKEASSWASPYSIDLSTIEIAHDSAKFTAQVKSSLYPDVKFGLDVRLHTDGVVRVRMDEINGLKKHYDEAASWALISEPEVSKSMKWSVGKTEFKAKFGEGQEFEIVVQFNPLKIVLLKESKEQIVLNGQGLLHMEHFRSKKVEAGGEQKPEGSEGVEDAQTVIKVQPNAWFEGEDEDAYWEETFGSWTDSKPKGPESLSIDISFPNHANIYGIPQHATRLSLPSTTGESPHFEDPYRLYNTDVFEYIASSPMSLYGSIPILHAHSADSTVGIFHAVGSETWIDVSHATDKSTETHWISESGILDIFLMPGPTPADVFAQYARLTGTPVLPAHWALGYHQCRWNYISSDDVRTVQKRFDEEGMPVDVFWLDIEYSQDHKYFMWEPKNFPDPVDMINDVAATGRHMVVIVDPHLKRVNEYPVYKEASERGVLVKPKSGEGEYEGWCWSGSSSWIDFFNPGAWDWWKSLFKPYQLASGGWSWTQSTEAVHIWNDMNEPSVFNGPEISMPRDNVHYNGWEHRDIHNINGMLFSNATYQALLERSDPPQRPFVLTRSFFAGSQRFGAMWTGDNLGTWEHMEVGVKMVLANGIAGMSFGGSDVGGFFGNPEPEMLVRWYQVGAMAPFFRAHAHIDTKRREPYLLDQPYKDIVRDILRLRYTMLPVWYTAFRETTVTGLPVLRPHYVMFPEDKNGFDLDGQYYIGSSGLLVKPVTEKGATEASVYLAEDQVYYDYFSHQVYRGSAKGKNITVPAALHQLPLFIRGGSIVSTRERPRRASTLMKRDPFTLRVALDKKGSARGELYIDDGETYSHRNGEFIWRQFFADKGKKELRISSKDLAALRPSDAVDGVALKTFNPANEFAKSVSGVRVERIVVLGLGSKPKSVKVEGGQILEWEYTPGAASNDKKDGAAGVLVIKDPATPIANNWEILVQF